MLPLRLGRKLDIRPDTILVYVGEGLIGDAFMRLPFAAALRETYPQARISWAFRDKASPGGRRIAPLLSQFCHETLFDLTLGDGPGDWLKPRPYPDRGWDLVIDTQRVVARSLLVSRIRHRRFASFAGRYCLSDVKPVEHWRQPCKVQHYGRQLMSLLSVIESGALAPARPFVPAPLAIPPSVAAWTAHASVAGAGAIMIAPGAGGRQKCWPVDRVAALARSLQAAGQTVVFLTGPADDDIRDRLAATVPAATFPLDLMPREIAAHEPFVTMALARHAAVTLAMDSGIGHMLAATSPHHVVLFGPTKPATFTPAARSLRVITAQEFQGTTMADIPASAALRVLLEVCRAEPLTRVA